MKGPSEKDIQNQILEWFSWQQDYFVWPNQSVGIFDKAKKVYRKPHSRFHRNGVPDILGLTRQGRLLAIEVKKPGGRLSEDQRSILKSLQSFGAIALVAFSLDDLRRKLAEYD